MGQRRLRVMQSFRRPRPTSNPYIHMLDDALAATDGLTHLRFSWRTALWGSYDVIHFQWPEVLLTGSTPLRRLARRVQLQALLLRLRLRRTAIVRTIHNLELPSGMSAWERRMLAAVRDRAHVGIALNTRTPTAGPTAYIPHGHYIDWFAGMDRTEPVAGQIAFVGLIRRYKGVEGLVDAYAKLRQRRDDIGLSVSGRPTSLAMAEEIKRTVARIPGATVELTYLSESMYARAVTEAALVVLPYVHMHNSGSALAVLSLGRPVLVPDNEVNRALSAEIGDGWVHLFAGDIDATDIERAIDSGIPDASVPDLSARHWDDVGQRHLRAYRSAMGMARPGKRR